MRILKPKFEILIQEPYMGIDGVFQMIKTAGQTCYDSESKRTPSDFVQMLIKSGHGAMLEHGTVYITLKITKDNCTKPFEYKSAGFTGNYNWTDVVGNIGAKYRDNQYSYVHYVQHGTTNSPVHAYYITTNYRVIIENGWEEDLQFITAPTEYHEKRVTVRFTTQIAISREYNRHRVNSIAEQSTRYCNYSKDKYDGQISVVCPTWVDLSKYEGIEDLLAEGGSEQFLRNSCQAIFNGLDKEEWSDILYWLFGNLSTEYAYINLIRLGRSPQEARTVLALDTRTELVHTAFVSDWKHFFDLRALGTTGKPHPDAKILAEPLMEEFKRLKLI
jgi:thymidylate synthase (FAD)